MKHKKTTEQFINEAIIVHGNKYNYSLTSYKGCNEFLNITCKVHGVFKQKASNHLRGYKCSKCANKSNTKTTEQFIENAKTIHGDKYDYSKVQYVNAKSKVIIVCRNHGEFLQLPSGHLSGNKCKKCSSANNTKTTSTFIEESNVVHSNMYNYRKTEYVGTHDKLAITCREHGDFNQTANSHLNGNGCPKCIERDWNFVRKYTLNEELGNEPGAFYKLLFTHKSGFQFIKIGITSRTIHERYYGSGYDDFSFKVLEEIKTTNLESALLERKFMKETELKKFKFPNNIRFNGASECYYYENNS